MKTEKTIFWTSLVLAFLFIAALAGSCKKDNYNEISGVCPVVESTNPTKDAINVPLDQIIEVTFNDKMNPATITPAAFTLTYPTTKIGTLATDAIIEGSLTYNEATKTMSFNPANNLKPNTVYTGTVKTSVKNLLGSALQTNYVWSFTTGIPPTVISTFPQDAANGVSINSKLTATFSMSMDSLSITDSTFILKQGNNLVSGNIISSNNIATFKPTTTLAVNVLYTATITNKVKNKAGITMTNNYVWTFTTGSGSDNTPPEVISTVPANLATGVAINISPSATFSEVMDPMTITPNTFIIRQGNMLISGSVSYVGTVATFKPLAGLVANTTYTATITTGVEDVTGNAMASNYVWTFTTGSSSDDTPPTVISTVPADLATGVAINSSLSAKFSEVMNPITITPSTFTLKQENNIILGSVSYVGLVATFNPSVSLNANTVYTATITTGVEDLAGNAMESNYVWTFTTGAGTGTDIIPPTVVSTIPANMDTEVLLNIKPSATFSELMDPLTINTSSYTLKQGTTLIPGLVSYTGLVATFSPSNNLLPNTIYTATITNSVKDLAGNTMLNNYVWTFTTLATSAPTVISTDPANLDTDVALNKVISADFSEEMNSSTITTSTFTLMEGTNLITALVDYSGITATLTPSSDLLPNTTYTATITTGVENLSGTSLSNDFVWTFTTEEIVISPIDLGTAAPYGAFGGNAGITNQGINTIINGGISTTAASTLVTGFHDGMTGDVYTETPLNVGLVTDGIFTAPPFPGTTTTEAIATQALVDANAAYISISPAVMPGGTDPGAGELGGLTLAPGVYMSASGTFNISNGPLTLDAQGDPNATWVFQTASGLTVGIAGPDGARSIVMINGALPKNVFWYVGSAATINAAGGGTMVGTIIATAGVTISTPDNMVQTVLNGRAISLVASVTMVNTTINVPAP